MRVMVYVRSARFLCAEYLRLNANPRSEAYDRTVVYPISVTGMVMDSPLCMLITLDLNDVFSIFLFTFVCRYVQIYNIILDFQIKCAKKYG